jgi:hypothetical protein
VGYSRARGPTANTRPGTVYSGRVWNLGSTGQDEQLIWGASIVDGGERAEGERVHWLGRASACFEKAPWRRERVEGGQIWADSSGTFVEYFLPPSRKCTARAKKCKARAKTRQARVKLAGRGRRRAARLHRADFEGLRLRDKNSSFGGSGIRFGSNLGQLRDILAGALRDGGCRRD